MRFLFDCEDEVCLPKAYHLVDKIKPFIDKVKEIEVEEGADRKSNLKKVVENIMCKYPKETGEMLSQLWILEDGETAPNAFKTIASVFSSEVAIDFFTSVLPSLLTLSRSISPLLNTQN